jgi:DUF971 family protein
MDYIALTDLCNPKIHSAEGDKAVPKPSLVTEFSESTLYILWDDGHESLYLYEDLRRACPCASCIVERRTSGKRVKRIIPMGVPAVRIAPKEVEEVGLYALRFRWNDGHEAGIYTYGMLRSLCSCSLCSQNA